MLDYVMFIINKALWHGKSVKGIILGHRKQVRSIYGELHFSGNKPDKAYCWQTTISNIKMHFYFWFSRIRDSSTWFWFKNGVLLLCFILRGHHDFHFHNHWWTASIKPSLLFPHACYSFLELSLFLRLY